MLPSKFYPLADDVKWVEAFAPIGVSFMQLRLKEKPRVELEAQINDALVIASEFKTTLVINDYWDIAIDKGASWVHLGQSDLDGADIDAIKSAGLKFGTSTHDHDELNRVLKLDPNYVALGPIYNTVSKEMYRDPQGLERISEWKSLLKGVPLVGIGGIRLESAEDVLDAGADAVSCIGDVLLHDQPIERAKQWLKLIG